jgi:TPR repeat protein
VAKLFVDLTKEAAELQKKADAGDAQAQYSFAFYLLHESDLSVREDLSPETVEYAFNYLQKAAAAGYGQGLAALDLADCYYRGEVTPKDYKKARMWYNTALLKDNAPAACMLGDMAYNGHGCDIDYEEAARYYLQAAPNYTSAVYRLADMYLHGDYFPADPVFARELYEYILANENRFFEMHNLHSDAYDAVRLRLDNIERGGIECKYANVDESPQQKTARDALVKIMQKADNP